MTLIDSRTIALCAVLVLSVGSGGWMSCESDSPSDAGDLGDGVDASDSAVPSDVGPFDVADATDAGDPTDAAGADAHDADVAGDSLEDSTDVAPPTIPQYPAGTVLPVPCTTSPGGCGDEIEPGARVEGEFHEWTGAALVEEVGDDANSTDIRRVWVQHDADWLYVRVELDQLLNIQEDNGLTLFLDLDDNPNTGRSQGGSLGAHGVGAELEWTFGQRRGEWYGPTANGAGGGSAGIAMGHGAIGLASAPTFAASEFEIALRRGARPAGAGGPELLAAGSAAVRISMVDRPWESGGDAAPNSGMARYELGQALPTPPPIRWARSTDADVRIASWNMFESGALDPTRAPAFRDILRALRPDVIAFQEAWDVESLAMRNLLDAWLPLEGGSWHTRKSSGLIVASRFPLGVSWANAPLERAMAVVVQQPGRPFVLVNAHFSCCGAEGERQRQADGFVSFIRQMRGGPGDAPVPDAFAPGAPLVLVGDLNLVGTDQPLRTLVTGEIENNAFAGASAPPDSDGTPLRDLVSRVAGAPVTTTFRTYGPAANAPGGSIPGRLDFVIYGDADLTVRRHFIADTQMLEPAALQTLQLQPGTSGLASDHRPHVVDFAPGI